MLFQISLFFIGIIGIFILSRMLLRSIFLTLFLILRNRDLATTGVILILFPGTVVHELSHLFMAGILGVPAGKLTLAPDSIRKPDITMGSVKIARTGPFKRLIIGISPILSGILLLTAISALVTSYFGTPMDIVGSIIASGLTFRLFLIYFLILYLVFAVSNTMYSSPEDLKDSWGVILIITLAVICLFILGFRLNVTGQVENIVSDVLSTIVQALAVVMALNIGIFVLSSLITRYILKIRHLKIVPAP